MKTIVERTLKNFWVIALLFPLMFSCRSDRPRPFLNTSRMSDLMCEIRLAEAHLYQTREKNTEESNRVMIDRALDIYVPIFQKYGINYKQFQAIEDYYMHHPEKMEKVMKETAEKLKERHQQAKLAQESESTEEKAS